MGMRDYVILKDLGEVVIVGWDDGVMQLCPKVWFDSREAISHSVLRVIPTKHEGIVITQDDGTIVEKADVQKHLAGAHIVRALYLPKCKAWVVQGDIEPIQPTERDFIEGRA